MSKVQINTIIMQWQNSTLTAGQALDELLDIIEESHPILYNRILQSCDCYFSNYLTDEGSIELIRREFNEY